MHRPPDRRTPPILFSRSNSDWISRVNQKHKQLTELQLSTEQRATLDRWAETEFVYSTLRLEGFQVTQEQIAELRSASAVANAAAETDRVAMALLESLRTVAALAHARGRDAALTPELLLKLHQVPDATPGYRQSAGGGGRPRAENLPAMIESACQWYTAESFTELHPVEQASIVLMRLIELQPFEQANERSALVSASLFTLRSELPPIIVRPEMHAAYGAALDEGIRMNTKPMVELVAEAAERSLAMMIDKTGKQR